MTDRFAKRQKTALLKDKRPVCIGRIIFVLCLLSIVLCPLRAITVEQEQQFTYYWYAAKQAITEERYTDAFALLHFCEALNPEDAATLDNLGAMYDAMKKQEQAMSYYRRAFQTDPRDHWYRYYNALMEQRTPATQKEALSVLEQAYSKQQPKPDEDLLEQLRRLYLSEGQYAKAIKIQDDIDAQHGYDAYSAFSRMQAYVMWGKTKKALAEVDRYLEQDPTNIRFLLYRIDIQERSGAKPDKLFKIYEQILSFDPYNLQILNNYAYLLAVNKGDLQKAERMSAITIREQPENPVFLDTYGWIMHLKGQDTLALFYLRKALSSSDERTSAEIKKHIEQIEK